MQLCYNANNTSAHSLLNDGQAKEVLLPQNVLLKPVAVMKRKSLSLIYTLSRDSGFKGSDGYGVSG